MPGQEPGTLKNPHVPAGTASAASRAGGAGLEVHVAAQAATVDSALDLPGGVAVVVREHHALQRHGDHLQAQHVFLARFAGGGYVQLAARKSQLARLAPVDVDGLERIEVLQP